MATKVINPVLTEDEKLLLSTLGNIMERLLHDPTKHNTSPEDKSVSIENNNKLSDIIENSNPEDDPGNGSSIQESSDNKIVLGKNGRRIIYNNELIQKLLDDGLTLKQITEKYNLNYQTFSMYVRNNGFNYNRRSRNKKNNAVSDSSSDTSSEVKTAVSDSTISNLSNPPNSTNHGNFVPKPISITPKKIDKNSQMYKGYIKCPVCKKMFYPASQHIYHDKRNNKVCSYSCARKSGGM